jgi:sec-independent protein translocase protein TatA
MSNIGLPEIAIVLVIVLVIFGPKRLPQLGRSLGSGMREFKDAVTGKSKDEPEELEGPPPIPADRVANVTANNDESTSPAKTADAS